MTDQEIRIAIFEAQGWKPNGHGYWHKDGNIRGLIFEDMEGRCSDVYPMPNYPYDLNAMYEAEKILDTIHSRFADDFGDHLTQIVLGFGPNSKGVICMNAWSLRRILHATAKEHAEALLKTLGLWKESV
jgi:hypothetical protein